MEINQELGGAQSFSALMCQRILNSDVSEDFTIPDYCPEIRRVLYLKEELPAPARFVSGSKIDVSGVVDYTLVYVNSEGEVCSAPLSAEYSFALPIENANDFELGEGVSVMAHTVAENSSVRVSAPRRLQIRSHLRTGVCAFGKMRLFENFEGLENEDSVERLLGEAECADLLCESSEVITLEDEYLFSKEGCGVALADSSVALESVRTDGESVLASGEAVVKMLINCDGKSESVVRRIPFEAEIDVSGVDMSHDPVARVNGFVTDVALEVEEERINIELSLILEACVAQNRPFSYVRDVYSTEQECECQTKEISLPTLIGVKSFNLTQSEKLERAELNFPEGAQIVHVYASACFDGVKDDEGRRMLTGSCKYDLICLVGGEYTHVEARLPFEQAVDIDGAAALIDGIAHVGSCKARSDGENIIFESDISVHCVAFGSREVQMPSEIAFMHRREDERDRWIVYYLCPGDDAWSIAKRYGVREDKIRGDISSDRFVMIER